MVHNFVVHKFVYLIFFLYIYSRKCDFLLIFAVENVIFYLCLQSKM